MFPNDIKITQKIKNKGQLSIEKNIINYGKIEPLRKKRMSDVFRINI